MSETSLSRRRLMQTGAVCGLAGFTGIRPWQAFALDQTSATPPLTPAERDAIDAALGKKGAYNEPQATHVIALPRNDLSVSVKGEPTPIPLGFGGWAAFKRTLDGKTAVFMSDNVLLEEEVNPLIDAVLAAGLQVGAIHNHFLYENPRMVYMHVHGMGDPAELAKSYAAALANSKILSKNQPAPTPPPKTAKEIFDTAALDTIVGKTGVVNGPAFKYTVGRSDLKIMEMGAEMTAAIGLNTWCTFVGTPVNAVVAGDVAMLAHEVGPTIRLLRQAGIEVCALHSHMLTETPASCSCTTSGREERRILRRLFGGFSTASESPQERRLTRAKRSRLSLPRCSDRIP